MGFLDLKYEKNHLQRIQKALAKRGLKIDKADDWEVHGPHEKMNYQVYVGYAYSGGDLKARCTCPNSNIQNIRCKRHKRCYCVAIYPRSVYEIEDTSDWWKTNQANRIYVD